MNFYKKLEEKYPSTLGRIYAVFSAISASLLFYSIKTTKKMEKLDLMLLRGVLNIILCHYLFKIKQPTLWPSDPSRKTALIFRLLIAGLAGMCLILGTPLVDVQIFTVILSLSNPFTVIFERIRGKQHSTLTWLYSIGAFIGVVICINPGLFGPPMSFKSNLTFFNLFTRIQFHWHVLGLI